MKQRVRTYWVTVVIVLFLPSVGLCTADLRKIIEDYVSRHQRQIVSELVELLSIPNVAADREDIRRNAGFLKQMLQRRGFSSEVLETQGNPLVYGEWKVPEATRTILFYIHYDGQPVNPARWEQANPFMPIMRDGRLEDRAKEIVDFTALTRFEPDWRIYGRSASDDKSPAVAFCAAIDALRAAGRMPTSNLRIVLDGEEETGSTSLTAAIERYRDKFKADVMFILDGPLHASGRPTLTFGARGIITLELTLYGPKFALHSGHYGNWAPNPAMRLAQLLATMKDDHGRVVVEGFYDSVPALSAKEQQILEAVPDDAEKLRKLFGFAEPDDVGQSLQEAIQFPSLNVRGLQSAYVGGGARTIIPAEATAAIDIRLIKETHGSRLVQGVVDHIRKQGYHIVDRKPDNATRLKYSRIIKVNGGKSGGTEAYRTEMDLPESIAAIASLERIWGREPVRIRTSGGTVPISNFIKALGFPAIIVPTVNFDNNQHSENENLRIGHFWNAIVTMGALLTL